MKELASASTSASTSTNKELSEKLNQDTLKSILTKMKNSLTAPTVTSAAQPSPQVDNNDNAQDLAQDSQFKMRQLSRKIMEQVLLKMLQKAGLEGDMYQRGLEIIDSLQQGASIGSGFMQAFGELRGLLREEANTLECELEEVEDEFANDEEPSEFNGMTEELRIAHALNHHHHVEDEDSVFSPAP